MLDDARHERVVKTDADIRVYVSDWQGSSQFHVRKFIDTNKYTGPTKQGVTVPVDDVPALVAALLAVFAAETGKELTVSEIS